MNNCGEWTSRLVDNARAGVPPSPVLLEHLSGCPGCAGRWRNERVLTRELQILSDRAASHRPPQRVRELVMQEFERQRRAHRWRWLRWVPAPAAALLVVVAVLGVRHRDVVTPVPQTMVMAAVPTDASEEGFVDVPYAPPLAPGEFVSVVRQELEPAELVRMGLPYSGIGEAPVMADVVVGEDGFPRAVRVSDESVTEF
jgi:hypothetical protein